MSLITPDFGLLFWMTIVFLIVLGIVSKFGFKVIVKMVNDRKDYIDSSLQKAHEANKKLANIKVESDALLQEARERQAAILKEAAATRDAIVEKAQDKAVKISISLKRHRTKLMRKVTDCLQKRRLKLRIKDRLPLAISVNKLQR